MLASLATAQLSSSPHYQGCFQQLLHALVKTEGTLIGSLSLWQVGTAVVGFFKINSEYLGDSRHPSVLWSVWLH